MTVRGDIVAETGLDLANGDIANQVLAPMFAARLYLEDGVGAAAFPFKEQALFLARQVMSAWQGAKAGATATPFGVYGAAYSFLKTAAGLLEGRLDDDISGNYKRLEVARNLTVQQYIRAGDWSVVVPAGGVPIGDVDLKNNIGGWNEGQFLAQYNPGIVWMAKRTGADFLLPTWPSAPYTNGYGFRHGSQGSSFPLRSALAGWSRRSLANIPGIIPTRDFYDAQPQVAPFPDRYDATYFGSMPVASAEDMAQLQGAYATKLKHWESLIQKLEATLFAQPFVPPPDYTYLFSVGTYPYTSWSTAAGDGPMTWGSPTILNGTMAATAAAIHSFTPLHAAIPFDDVARCYRAWQATSRLAALRPVQPGQFDAEKCGDDLSCGVFRDKDGLPFSQRDESFVQFVQPLPKGAEQDPRYPAGFGPSYRINWRVVKAIEESYRSFFRIRRAATFQMDLLDGVFRDAAAASPDPVLAAAAKGKPPAYAPWSQADPLGDGAGVSDVGGIDGRAPGGAVDPGDGGSGGGGGGVGMAIAAGVGGIALAAGIAAALRGRGKGGSRIPNGLGRRAF